MARSLRPVVVLAALLPMLAAATGAAQAAKKVIVGPGDSIQAAVDAAQPGDTILVKGRHQENVAITTDGITLRGLGAVLAPAATPTQNACTDPSAPADVNGICILGDVNFVTGEVIREVRDVTISGFTPAGAGSHHRVVPSRPRAGLRVYAAVLVRRCTAAHHGGRTPGLGADVRGL